MRKIDNEASTAFHNGKNFKSGDTEVKTEKTKNGNESTLLLHGNRIAFKNENGFIEITNAGYPTQTTKARLNAIPGVSIVQKAGKWILNGKEWDGEWTTV